MKRLLHLTLICLVAISTSAWQQPMEDVPAFNSAPPKKGMAQPPILSGDQLTGPNFQHPAQVASYKAAVRHADVLHQLPCYCHCDRGFGHNSLRSCFVSTHGAHCSTCMQEALFAEQMVKQGKTAKQIREAIMAGEHQKIDLRTITAGKN